jgi:hypothetical protein
MNLRRVRGDLGRTRGSATAHVHPVLRWSALTAATVALAACSDTTTAGTAHPAADPVKTTTTSVPAPAPSIVPAAGINTKLLSVTQLGAIVGDTDMRPVASYAEPNMYTSGIEPVNCVGAAVAATANAYFSKTRIAMAGDTNRGTGGQVATQVISVFGSRTDPANLLVSYRLDWASCLRKPSFTTTGSTDDVGQHWTASTAQEADVNRLSITLTRTEPPPRTCHHVVATQANVGVEAIACGDGDTTKEANEIVDTILAKIPK